MCAVTKMRVCRADEPRLSTSWKPVISDLLKLVYAVLSNDKGVFGGRRLGSGRSDSVELEYCRKLSHEI